MQLQNLAGNSRKARGRKFQSPDPQNGDVERPVAHTSRGPWHDKRQFVTDNLLSRMSLVQLMSGDDDRRPTPTDTYQILITIT